MISLFRKIRRDLMEKKATGKYFKYAIGEIVLVVIGILIALQINNWNEHRTAQNRIDRRLVNLVSDLKSEISEMDDILDANEKRMVVIYEILKRTDKLITFGSPRNLNFTMTLDSIANPNAALSVLRTLDGNRATYNELVNSGEFYLINQKELAKMIQDYYATVDEITDSERWNNQETWLMINRSKHRLGLGTYSIFGTIDKLVELALQDQQFAAELEHEMMLDYSQRKMITKLKDQALQLIEAIEARGVK